MLTSRCGWRLFGTDDLPTNDGCPDRQVLVALVAVVGLAINQGWLSGKSIKSTKSGGGPAATSTAVAVPQYALDTTSLVFQALGPTTQSVKVSNVGVVPMTVEAPQLTGAAPSHFSAVDQTCGGSVEPGRSCQIQVTFLHAPGTFNATLVVKVTGAAQETEVPITATAIL